MRHFIVLFLVAILCQAVWFTLGYSLHWWGAGQINYDIEYVSYLIIILPVVWIMWVNGKDKFVIRLFIYISFFVTYFFSYFFISNNLNLHFPNDGIFGKYSIVINRLIWILATLVILAIGNYIMARIEGIKLTGKNVIVLFISQISIPFICFLWSIITPLILDYRFGYARNGIQIFAFILFEGTYFLWLKGRIHLFIANAEQSTLKNKE